MPVASIVIRQNPVLSVPVYVETLTRWDRYRHEIRAMGGFWECAFGVSGDLAYLTDHFANSLGRHVESFSADGRTLWEGMITGMTLRLAGATLVASLGDMANKVWVRWSNAGTLTRSTAQADADSQARYGVKEQVLSGGELTGSSVADQAATAHLNAYANPRRSRATLSLGGGAGAPALEFQAEGYARTLGWRTYNQTTPGANVNANVEIATIVTAVGQFIRATELSTNATQVTIVYDADRTAWAIIADIARLGDSSNNRWLVGAYEGRVLRYAAAKSASLANVQYVYRASDPAQTVWSRDGRVIPPEEVRPDNWLRVADVFPIMGQEQSNLLEDPQSVYVESAAYSEPDGLRITGSRGAQVDVLLARAGYGGASLT